MKKIVFLLSFILCSFFLKAEDSNFGPDPQVEFFEHNKFLGSSQKLAAGSHTSFAFGVSSLKVPLGMKVTLKTPDGKVRTFEPNEYSSVGEFNDYVAVAIIENVIGTTQRFYFNSEEIDVPGVITSSSGHPKKWKEFRARIPVGYKPKYWEGTKNPKSIDQSGYIVNTDNGYFVVKLYVTPTASLSSSGHRWIGVDVVLEPL